MTFSPWTKKRVDSERALKTGGEKPRRINTESNVAKVKKYFDLVSADSRSADQPIAGLLIRQSKSITGEYTTKLVDEAKTFTVNSSRAPERCSVVQSDQRLIQKTHSPNTRPLTFGTISTLLYDSVPFLPPTQRLTSVLVSRVRVVGEGVAANSLRE